MAIHSQCFHQQAKVLAMVIESFVRVVGTHDAKIEIFLTGIAMRAQALSAVEGRVNPKCRTLYLVEMAH